MYWNTCIDIIYIYIYKQFPAGSDGQESTCQCRRGRFDPWVEKIPLEKGMATHSSTLGLPWWLRWWRIHLQCRRPGFNPWVGKIPWRRKWQPTLAFLLRESHGKRSLTLLHIYIYQFSSVAQSCPTLCDPMNHSTVHSMNRKHPCPSPTPRLNPNPCPLSRGCHPTILSSVIPFSSCLQSLPSSRSFPLSQLFESGGQSIGVSASVLPMHIQGWFPLGLTALIT